MGAHTVDVLIPVFNSASTIDQAIDSIRAQTLRDIRIIIVDDGSTDGTASILANHARADGRINVITKANSGIVDSLNEGLRHCAAEFIARFDADDVAYPHRLAAQVQYLRANPDCVAAGCHVGHIDGNGDPIEGLYQPGIPKGVAERAPAREPYIVHSFLLARASATAAIGGYRFLPTPKTAICTGGSQTSVVCTILSRDWVWSGFIGTASPVR
jgi:glycosyltransferase involved in cell wall biosynthesis